MSETHKINLFALKDPKIKTLHITWFAFFLSFMVWFNHAPLLVFMKEAFDMTSQQVKALMILNVALTIPARIFIGILVDKIGPRKVYSGLLILSSFFCLGVMRSQQLVLWLDYMVCFTTSLLEIPLKDLPILNLRNLVV